MLKEFKEFALKGNVMDLAVGVIIGAAFGKIVSSLVNDIISPIIGIVFKADFTNMYIPLSDKVSEAIAANASLSLEEAKKIGPVLGYGNFITEIINFIIMAFVIFMLVKGMNSMKKKKEAAPAAPPAPTKDQLLLEEIRDLLKK